MIPPAFQAFSERGGTWPSWLDGLPRLIEDLLAEWKLRPDGSAATGECAIVVPVVTGDGVPAALKVGWPHEEAEHEHLALRAWAGAGTVRLLRADPRRSALLLERADAARDLTTVPVLEACSVIAGLYPRLHIAALPQLRLLSDSCARWAKQLQAVRGHPQVPRRYVDRAVGLATDFAADPDTDGQMVHADLHFFNVLAAEREPWLVIDPKPLSGDPAYEIAPLLWNRWDEAVASGDVREDLLGRLYTVLDVTGLDTDRAKDWIVVRMMVNLLWALEDLDEGRPVDPDWMTTCITIVKAVQP